MKEKKCSDLKELAKKLPLKNSPGFQVSFLLRNHLASLNSITSRRRKNSPFGSDKDSGQKGERRGVAEEQCGGAPSSAMLLAGGATAR